ncbi:MAG: DUF2029 domain-containing protein [Gammaproteobacteria bacterium]|nr:DUF2029 domain-containing protein [Gammaproteobacteria bacterium]
MSDVPSKWATAVALVITVLAVVGFAVFATTQLPDAAHGAPDFPNYYFGGERFLSGEPVYGPIGENVRVLFDVDGYDAYPADPPLTVVLLAPLSLLPYTTAWWLFAALSVVLLAGVGYATAKEAGWSRTIAVAVGAAMLITSAGRFLLLRNHMEAILLLLLFLGWRGVRRGRDIEGGVWWGLAVALKLFPALLIVGLLAMRRTKAAMSAVITAVVASGLGVAILGWDDTVAFISDVLPASKQWYGAHGNYSLLSFGTAVVAEPFGWVLAALGAVGLIWWYWRRAETVDQVWVGGVAAALLISPLSWLNYLVLVLPCVVLIAQHLDVRTVHGRWTLLGLTVALGFWAPIVLSGRVPSVLLSFVPVYGLLALFVLGMRRAET